MVRPERRPRRDISVLVNHLRDVYYLMGDSLFEASSGLEALLQKEALVNFQAREENADNHNKLENSSVGNFESDTGLCGLKDYENL